MVLYRGYEPATRCTDGPSPGALALMSWFLGAYPGRARNLGVYNCRPVAGSSVLSVHSEGRACDLGVQPEDARWGMSVADALRRHSRELGVQCVVWSRRIWSGAYADAGWRTYSGSHPHTDHLHVELTRDAAATLTTRHIRSVLARRGETSSPRKDRPVLKRGSRSRVVGDLQRFLNRVYPLYASLVVDGVFGPATETVVREFQRRAGVTVDGVVGPQTWRALGL